VTQYGRTGFTFGFGFDVFRQLVNVTDVLGDGHDRVFLPFAMPALISLPDLHG
jgi:hypothetical protein